MMLDIEDSVEGEDEGLGLECGGDARDDNFLQIRWRIRYLTRMEKGMERFFGHN